MTLQEEIEKLEEYIGRKIEDFGFYDWHNISICRKLSEPFMDKHFDKLNSGWISRCQPIISERM